MNERRELPEMISETLREMGVLVLVFGMLDKFVHDVAPSALWTSAVLGVGLSFLAIGYMIERRRRP